MLLIFSGDHRCPNCDKKFVSSAGRRKHHAVCKSLVPCKICGKPVPKGKLEWHTWSHKSPEEALAVQKANSEMAFIQCAKCGKLYHGVAKLLHHQSLCKINWHDELDMIPASSEVTCPTYGRPVLREELLPRHEWTHLNAFEQWGTIRNGKMPKFQLSQILLENGKVSEAQIRKWMQISWDGLIDSGGFLNFVQKPSGQFSRNVSKLHEAYVHNL